MFLVDHPDRTLRRKWTVRRRAPAAVRERFDAELAAARTARSQHLLADAWSALEVLHIVSQPWAVLHLRSHWAMLVLATRTMDGREAVGQVARFLVAAPGSVTGRYPVGNTGRARISMFAPMPMPDELGELLSAS